MSEVKRYDHDCYEYEAGSYMTERLDGDYVLHSDYEKLKAQLERAEKVIKFYFAFDNHTEEYGENGDAAREYFKEKEQV